MRVLGLDPGSRRTGFGVVEGSGKVLRCLIHGHALPPPRQDLPHRIHTIAERAGEIMDQFEPDMVALEEAFYHESVRSTLVLGHVRGALLVAAVQRGVTVAEYSPREVKLSVTGTGGATKEQVGYMVQRLLALRGSLPVDAADALAVALCRFGGREELKLFALLVGVSGVGPRLALAVLSGLRPDALVRAIRSEEIGSLVAIPGIGRKTAERLVVELRDKLEAPVFAR